MTTPRFVSTAFNDVRISGGRLAIDPAVQHLLRHVLAPTTDPHVQLRHLEWTIELMRGGAALQEQADRLVLHALRQLKQAIELEMSYQAFLLSSGARHARTPEYAFLTQAVWRHDPAEAAQAGGIR